MAPGLITISYFFNLGTFDSVEVTHVEGDIDPVRDLEIIHDELRLKDQDYIDKRVEHLGRTVLRGSADKSGKAEYVS